MEPANDWGKNERVRSTNNKCSYSWLCCTHTSTTFSSSSMSIPFDTQQYRCCRLSAFAEIMYILHTYIYIYIPFGFIRGTEFNIVSLFYFTFFFLSCIVSIIVEQTLFGFPTTFACQLENCVFSTVRTSNGTHKNWWSHSQFELKNRSVFVVHYFRCKYHSNTSVEASLSVTVAVEWII